MVACGTKAVPPQTPEPTFGPDVDEPRDPTERPGDVTEAVPAGMDKWAQIAADLEKKAAAEPDVLVGGASVKKVVTCGGAAPPPGTPYSTTSAYGGEILIREGEENSTAEPVAVVQAGAQGVFSASLPGGTYCLVEASKKDKPQGKAPMYVDPKCLEGKWKKCDAVVEHPSGKPAFIVLYRPCFGPCYHGPMPP